MPSGFQQPSNQLRPEYYRVAINMAGYPAGAGLLTNGAVTPNSSDSFDLINLPTTLESGQARARGQMRFRNIVNRLSNISDCSILDIEITEANADAQAAALAFTVKYERPQAILEIVQTMLGSPYLGFDGATTVNSTVLALKDQIARGISDATSASARVYNGALKEELQQLIQVQPPLAAAAVWATVTVNLIDGTEVDSVI